MTTNEFTGAMRQTWALLFPRVPVLADEQWALWLLLHDGDTVRKGIATLAAKYRKLDGRMDVEYMSKFASSVMNRITQERRRGQMEHEGNSAASSL